MTIFNKLVDNLVFSDLAELLEVSAVENIQLEFKRDAPARDETLKKLSSFANTFGGHLVVGAEADAETGALRGIPGVEPINGYKQRVVSWCLAHITPPIAPLVSPPIPLEADPSRVCYVIHVPLSLSTPHFLGGRRGIYVRTDELSSRFEPRLATLTELQHLFDRRTAAVDERNSLRSRSMTRFEAFVANRYEKDANTSGEIGTTLHITAVPSYPVIDLITEIDLYRIGRETNVPWRQVGFPRIGADRITQRGSIITFRAGGAFSSLEVGVRGHIHYASELETTMEKGVNGIHFGALLGELLVVLGYAGLIFERVSYVGPVTLTLRVERCRDVPILYSSLGFAEVGPASPLDDLVEFDVETTSDSVRSSGDSLGRELLIALVFALNWADAIEVTTLDGLLKWAYDYNRWQWPGD